MENDQLTWLGKVRSYFQQTNPSHRNFYFVTGGAILLLLSVFFIYRSIVYKTQISEFDIKASMADVAGVAQGSHFLLRTTAPLSVQVLEKYIKMVPETAFNIERVSASENTFEIIPEGELKPDQIYTIQIDKGPIASHDFSWAYQIKAPFQVMSSIPGDKAIDVPANTGIEIYFNRDNLVNPEQFVEISPKAQGRFEVSENKVRFIPDNPLADKTIYTLRIKAGLKAKGSDDTFDEDKIIQFQTSQAFSSSDPSVYFSRKFSEFKPESSIVLGVNAYNTASVSADVYRLDSPEEFIASVMKVKGDTPWARYYTDNGTALPEDKKLFSGTLPLEKNDYSSLIRLPQQLNPGYYAAVIASGESTDISWFQVNPTASLAALAASNSLIWLKDIASGRSLAGTPIFYDNKQVGQTGADGAVLLETPEDLIRKPTDPYYDTDNRKFFIARINSGDLVIPIENEYGYSTLLSEKDKWWEYISLNKNVYLPTDTLHFWAILKSRNSESSGDEVSVSLSNPYWGEEEKNVTTYAETKSKVSEYNALIGEVSFANLKPGIYDLTFRKGEEIVAKQTVTVSAYIKPAYEITVTPDKNVVFAGDAVTFKVKAEFFDKTPVTNMVFSYVAYGSSYGKESTGNITLDSKGEGKFTVVTKYEDKDGQTYWPSYLSVNVRPTKAEEGQIEANSFVFIFGPHVHNSIDQKQSGPNVAFTVRTRAVVLGNEFRSEPYWNSEDYLGDPIAGATTKVDISEVVYLKKQTGTNYDPINKLAYPVYDYSTEINPVSSQTTTSDQNGFSKLAFNPEDKKTYRLVFTTRDSFGRTAEDTRYVYGRSDDTDYSFSPDSSYSLYDPNDNNRSYKIGEKIDLQLHTSEGAVPPERKESYIFMSVHNGSIEYKIQDTPAYSALFRSKDIPNIGIWPAWFSDGRFHNSYLQNISFDIEERRLNISITKDKPAYKPGETVNLDIKVTDKNKNPVKAEINLSALDEAVFSVKPGENDLVNDLYKDIYSQVIIRRSNMLPYGGGGAEKGGGDGDGPRSDMKEMAIFKSVTSDSNGQAHVEFKLPDNITSWRLTSQAVTKDLFAGKDISFIPVTLPFFVDATLNSTYLMGDNLILRLRTFGVAAPQGNTDYSIESLTLPFQKIEKTGGNNVDIPLGSLVAGDHNLAIKARNGGLSDELIKPLKVMNSYFTKNVSDMHEGIAGLKIQNNATGYTTLTFNSYGRGLLYNELKSISCECGIRIDQKGAKVIAMGLLDTYFGEKNEKPDFQAVKYQSYTGGLQLLPYSSEDLELSAISAHLFDVSAFNTVSLKNYFTASLSDKKSDASRRVLALYGLAAFHELVLTKIENMKDDKSLNLKDKIFIALALDSLGAKEESRAYYKQMIKPSVETKSAYAYMGGQKGDDTIIMTALTAALAASLEEPESTQLAFYVAENRPDETLDNFERLLYIRAALPRLDPENVSFTYRVGAKEESKALKPGESFELVLSPQELLSFELIQAKGKVGVVASYERQSSPDKVVKDNNLLMSRSYEVNGTLTKEFKEGDLIKVRMNPQFRANSLDGTYQIIDYLPSGLRPIDQESASYYREYDSRIYPTEINDQKVTFIVDKNIHLPIYYYARVVSKGVYKAEPATLQSIRNLGSMTISNEDSITIR